MHRKIVLLTGVVVLGVAALLLSQLTPGARSSPVVAVQSAPLTSSPAKAPVDQTEALAEQKPSAVVRPEHWPAELFHVRAQGARGQLVAYSMADGQQRFSLPPGMLSADGQHYVVAEPFRNAKQQDTMLKLFDPTMSFASMQKNFVLTGAWELSGVSYSGRWVALTRIASESEKQAWIKAKQWKTDVQIVDASNGQVAHSLKLDGNFEVETISPDSYSLFLVEHLPAINPDHYLIRLFDLYQEKLQPGALRDKVAKDEVMAGLAWEGLASPDGHWLLTLYLSTKRNTAFVHTLDLFGKYPVCIDLPSGNGDFNQLKYYTLALSPNGQRLYAANAALGVVAEISLNSRQVVRTANFAANAFGTAREYNPQSPPSRSVVSKDGSMVYFTSGWDVWAYDTTKGVVDGPYLINAKITGLGVSSDGKRLYVASADQPLAVFDTSNGNPLSFPRVAASTSMRVQ